MNEYENKLYETLSHNLKNNIYYEDTPYIPIYTIEELKFKIEDKHSKVHIGLINIP